MPISCRPRVRLKCDGTVVATDIYTKKPIKSKFLIGFFVSGFSVLEIVRRILIRSYSSKSCNDLCIFRIAPKGNPRSN